MNGPPGAALPLQVRALLADLGEDGTTRLQRQQLWVAVLELLHAAGFAVPSGQPTPQPPRSWRRKWRRQARSYEQRAGHGFAQLSAGERIHWLYLSVEDITDVEWLSLLAEIVEDTSAQTP